MRGILRGAVAGLILCAGATGLQGQTGIYAGVTGGVIFPSKGTSSFGSPNPNVKSIGYHAQLSFTVAKQDSKVAFRVDGQYGSVNYEKGSSGNTPKTKILTVNGDIVLLPMPTGNARPFILAGPTYGSFHYRTGTSIGDENTSGAGFNAGAGLALGKRGAKALFVIESRYIYTKDHKYIPVGVGVRINLKQPRASGG